MSREVDTADVEDISDLSTDDILYLMQREGTVQGPTTAMVEDLDPDLQQEIQDALQHEPENGRTKAQQRRDERAKKADEEAAANPEGTAPEEAQEKRSTKKNQSPPADESSEA